MLVAPYYGYQCRIWLTAFGFPKCSVEGGEGVAEAFRCDGHLDFNSDESSLNVVFRKLPAKMTCWNWSELLEIDAFGACGEIVTEVQ